MPPSLADTWSTSESLPDDLPESPFPIFSSWFEHAYAERRQPNTNAMTLATADPSGSPHARIVLCKAIHGEPGFIVFYTNYEGAKGCQLAANPRAAAVFHWDHFDRQVRLEGPVVYSPADESDAYFKSRHWTKRLGAWASDQSRPIDSRDDLILKVAEAVERLGLDLSEVAAAEESGEDPGFDIPRPDHWGGFRIWADHVELWCGGKGRVHDRAVWTRALTPDGPHAFAPEPWSPATRLQP